VASPFCSKQQWASFGDFGKYTRSAPSLLPPFPLSLPSPPWAYWDPGLPREKLTTRYLILKLYPQLVCQDSQSKPALNQLLGTGQAKTQKNCGCHTHSLTPPPQGESGPVCTGIPAPRHSKNTCHSLKKIHKKGPTYIQSRQPHKVGTATCHHSS
jgi:hypothetical protein